MNCILFQERLDDLLTAHLNPLADPEFMEHAASCIECRPAYEAAMQTLALLQPSMGIHKPTELKERIMTTIAAIEYAEPHLREPKTIWERVWIPSFAMTAAVALTILVVAAVLIKPSVQVYAIEQTIEANRGLQSVHLQITPVSKNCVSEIWAEFETDGTVKALRMNYPDTEDGPKDVVWKGDKAQIWFRAKGSLVTVREPGLYEKLKVEFGTLDPKRIVTDLYAKHSAGSTDVKIESKGAEPVVITATDATAPDREDVYTVDANTKWLRQHDVYRKEEGRRRLVQCTQYLGCNEPFPQATFDLQAPEDAIRIDQTTQEVGLVQGSLTDNETAVKVVREFFQALIAKDYAKAGRLMEGLPADEAKKMLGRLNITRIVSVGEPTPHPENKSLKVPCKLEVEVDGKTTTWEPHGPFVRKVHGQNDRWGICGGI